MKILKGKLKETRYLWPTVQLNQDEKCPLRIEKETVFQTNEVTYMSDKLGLHKISNPDPHEYAVSLHCKLRRCALPKSSAECSDSVHSTKRSCLWMQHLQRRDEPRQAFAKVHRVF